MSLLCPASDIWHIGVAHTPLASFLTQPLEDMRITWLPPQRLFCFIADPFGLSRSGWNYIFAERYDYRDKHGKIVFFEYSTRMELLRTGDALIKPFHLSYPFLVEEGGEVYMLPEAHRSGRLTLYRARQLPDIWESVCDLLDVPAVDASVIKHGGKWWMFFSLPGKAAKRELHVASAARLTGPWQMHPRNPVHVSDSSARMGGTPFVHEGVLYLPTQDCSQTYGGAISLLKVESLDNFACSVVRHIPPANNFAPYTDGLHTLSSFGNMTLLDAKRIQRSPMRHVINLQRRLQRLTGKH